MPWYTNYPVPNTSGDGVLFSIDFFVYMYVCLFIYFSVSLLARLRENGRTDLHETFREGVEWPWGDLITFLVNSEKPRDAAMRNTGSRGRGLLCFRTTAFCNLQCAWQQSETSFIARMLHAAIAFYRQLCLPSRPLSSADDVSIFSSFFFLSFSRRLIPEVARSIVTKVVYTIDGDPHL